MTPVPLLLGPVPGVCGYFLADLKFSRASRQVHRSTSEAVHILFDLVVLERLADASVTQAVTQMATTPDALPFRCMAVDLEWCRLEQIIPWRELYRIADEWDASELGDFADIMCLEEQGAAPVEIPQAGTRELQEGYLAKQRSRTQADTEALTIQMTLPVLILGLVFIIPPLFIFIGLQEPA